LDNEELRDELLSCGQDTYISSGAEIKRPHLVEIGNHVAIDSGVYITTAAKIGDYVHISPYVTCVGGSSAMLTIDGFNTISAGARLICLGDEHLGEGLVGPLVPDEYKDRLLGGFIHVEKFASIATNAIVMPGVTISEGSVIGAGAIVTRDTEPWTIYVGSPARPLKLRPKENMLRFAQELGY
jgi:acetyltransferase-like isoleucine patch superfamily enzyme